MKKASAAAVLAGLLSAGLVVPAHAATLPDPAPTNVQISWASDGSRHIHVTWDEDAPRPNRIFVRDLDAPEVFAFDYRTADAPNSVEIGALNLVNHHGRLQVVVVAGTSTTVTSPEGKSVLFDAHQPTTVVDSVTQTATGLTVKARPAPFSDTTPGDPLDDDGPVAYEPRYAVGFQQFSLGPEGQATEFSFSHPVPAYRFGINTRSRWSSGAAGDYVYVDHPNLAVHGPPARLQYDAPQNFSGALGPLAEQQSQLVVLQARNSPTSAWYAVTTNQAQPDGTGKYSFSVLARSREYRVAVPGRVQRDGTGWGSWTVVYGGYSAVMKSVAYQRVYGVFTTPKIRVGQSASAQAMLNVPLPTSVASLQRWNGKTWVFVQNITLKKNVGYAKVTSKTVGVSTYRIYSPNLTKDGMFVAAAYSPNFTLTTVR